MGHQAYELQRTQHFPPLIVEAWEAMLAPTDGVKVLCEGHLATVSREGMYRGRSPELLAMEGSNRAIVVVGVFAPLVLGMISFILPAKHTHNCLHPHFLTPVLPLYAQKRT